MSNIFVFFPILIVSFAIFVIGIPVTIFNVNALFWLFNLISDKHSVSDISTIFNFDVMLKLIFRRIAVSTDRFLGSMLFGSCIFSIQTNSTIKSSHYCQQKEFSFFNIFCFCTRFDMETMSDVCRQWHWTRSTHSHRSKSEYFCEIVSVSLQSVFLF